MQQCRSERTSGVIWPKLLFRAGLTLTWDLVLKFGQVAYGPFWLSLEYTPKNMASPDNLFWCLITWPWNDFPNIKLEFFFFQVKPIACSPFAVHPQKDSGSALSVTSWYVVEDPLGPLFLRHPFIPHTCEERMIVSDFFWVYISKTTLCKPSSFKDQVVQTILLNLWVPKSV